MHSYLREADASVFRREDNRRTALYQITGSHSPKIAQLRLRSMYVHIYIVYSARYKEAELAFNQNMPSFIGHGRSVYWQDN